MSETPAPVRELMQQAVDAHRADPLRSFDDHARDRLTPAEAESRWHQAHAANKRRTTEAQAQIDAARAEPTSAQIEAEMQDVELPQTRAGKLDAIAEAMREIDAQYDSTVEELRGAFTGIDPTPPDTITLSGAKLAAYRQLEAAAAAAHAAQQSMAATGQALRDAIQAMCAAIAPAKP